MTELLLDGLGFQMNTDEDRRTRRSRELHLENERRTFEEPTDRAVVDVRGENLHPSRSLSNEIDQAFFVRGGAQRWRDDRLVADRLRLPMEMREKFRDHASLLGQIDDLLEEHQLVAKENLRDERVGLFARRRFLQGVTTKIERTDFHTETRFEQETLRQTDEEEQQNEAAKHLATNAREARMTAVRSNQRRRTLHLRAP